MLNAIIHFSIHNKLIIGLFTLALIIWGGWSATQLPIDAVPDITNNQVQIITSSPSLAAEDIERLVTFPVEVGLSNIPNLIEIRSFSRFGLSIVTVVFTDATDIYWARQQIAERLIAVNTQIPPGVGTPTLAPVTTGLGEIFQYTVVPKKGYENRYTLSDLRTIQDWIIRRGLLGTPGVADVSGFGGLLKQYEIAVDPDRLRSYGITINDLFTALQQNNQNTGGAYIDQKPNAYFIRANGLIGSTDDIGNIMVKLNAQGLPIRVRDVAQIGTGSAVRYGAVTRNGQGETVGAIVMMIKGGNSSEVIKEVKAKIAEIQKTLPEGVQIIPFLDRTKMVNSAISTVERNLLEGAIIVIIVLVLLLGNWRAGVVVASVIPLALLFAISMMNLFGVSGNLMSLGAIDFGLIVDGAVIIVEATLHHIIMRNKDQVLTQEQMDDEVFGSASRIRSSAAFGEIIILIVYLPILALSGIEGKMFRPMALTVAFAILGAFILSLTYVPMVSALLLSKNVVHKESFSDKLMKRLHHFYEPILLWALRHRIPVLGAAIAMLVVAGFLFTRMGGEFIPQLDEGDFAVDTRTLTGSSLSETVDATLKAERILLKQFPEVEQVVAKIGSGEIPTDPMAIEAADQMIILKPKDQWTSATTRDELANKMAEALSVIPGVTFGFQQPVQMRFNELMTGARQDVALKIYGDDLQQLERLAGQVGRIIRTISGAKDLYVEQVAGLAQIQIQLDRSKLARFGLNVADVNRTINTAFAGQSAGQVFEGEKRFDLVVRLAADKRQHIEDVQNLYIATPPGPNGMTQQIPLSQLAQVSMQQAPNQIQRDNTHRRITLGFNVRGRDVESIVTELQQKVSRQIKLPPGYSVTYGGQFENLVDAKRRLGIAVPVALALIFALLFFTFHSIRQSLLIFMAIPLAAIGGIFALLIRDMPFSISAGVGFIALFGVSVLNGIVLIAEFNRLRHDEGLTDLAEIIRRGTEVRLRPVIMTALVASFGFIPMALSNSAGAEVQKPLATVVIGGLLTATLLTLLIIPILYSILEKKSIDREMKATPKGTTSIPATVILGFLLMAGLCRPQTTNAQVPQMVTLEQAIQQATTRNAQVQLAELGVNQQQALRRTAYDPGRLSAVLMLGQYNSRRFDNNLTLTQTIPNPTLMQRLAKLNDQAVSGRQATAQVTRNDVVYQVKQTYYDLLYLAQRNRLFQQQDTLLTAFVKAATVRLRVGETNTLEKATAESQLADQRVRLAQNQAAQIDAQTRLQTLLLRQDPATLPDQPLPKLTLTLPTDSSLLAQNPLLRQLQQQIQIAEQSRLVEQARLKPDFLIGFFSQTLTGNQLINGQELYFGPGYRFQGGQVGMTFPLIGGAGRARVEAARVGEQLAQKELQAQQTALQQQVAKAVAQYNQYRDALTYYEQTGLAQAQVIQSQAQRAFSGGDIGYVEYSLALQQALTIRLNYLDLLYQYDQSVLYLGYLAGTP
ncbi:MULTISPECIES: CusA/CzcA family heavy metal efflux RND transporter [unclassified Spirosoma]|uniref:CusA/CzcA family heavy metal efflux RND transporter n=1 Tax=unclassified Spirosoma TaxID=2621999 RepID=UPI00095F828A|nr:MULTISPECIES: CusA/CzcA family heavy metal efflux RND transporter [unclassified Spirosoma]MBN8826357.1 CusA/CzcA family heavy metal efflux RND transporter [Spirosoma sp.]OJW76126.1 MAG: acriflavine resistance protein B [Spirosoma sp. 48-14]